MDFAKAGEFKPQVVPLDIGLPKLNGYQVAEKLRCDERTDKPTEDYRDNRLRKG